jgi:hypothetical protein
MENKISKPMKKLSHLSFFFPGVILLGMAYLIFVYRCTCGPILSQGYEDLSTGVAVSLYVLLGVAVLLALTWLVLVLIPKTRHLCFLIPEIGGLVLFLIYLGYLLFQPFFHAQVATSLYAISVPLLIFGAISFIALYGDRENKMIRSHLQGDASVRLTKTEQFFVAMEAKTNLILTFFFGILGLALLILLAVTGLNLIYRESFGLPLSSDTELSFYLLTWLVFLPCVLFLVLSSLAYQHWLLESSPSWKKSLLPEALLAVVSFSLIFVPVQQRKGRYDSWYYQTYTAEKWKSASVEIRGYMLPDFEKQVNLTGKTYADVITYLSEPDFSSETVDKGKALYYAIANEWDGRDYYEVDLDSQNIVTQTRKAFRD